MRRAFSKLLASVTNVTAPRSDAVNSVFAPSLALAAMLLASPAAPAESPARSLQGRIILAQTLNQSANHCVSFEWAEQHSCPEGGASHRFIVTNSCSRAIMFNWNDNGRYCRRRSNDRTPCAILVRARGSNADYVNCVSGTADINFYSVFAE